MVKDICLLSCSTDIKLSCTILNILYEVCSIWKGLIEGAHEGVGLGDKFLRHIERCKNILHLIDINQENLIKCYSQVRKELKKYSKKLIKKKEIVVLNKTDLMDKENISNKTNELKKIIKDSHDMIYYISMLSTTGGKLKVSPKEIFENYNKIKKINKSKNLVIGFGITIKTISSLKKADGLVEIGRASCRERV